MNNAIVLWTVRSDGIRTALFTPVYSQSIVRGKRRRLWPLNTVHPTLISYEPSCNQAVKMKYRILWPLDIIRSKIFELWTRRLHSSFVLSQEAIGSKWAELIRILSLHSLTQRDDKVASPPIGDGSHKNHTSTFFQFVTCGKECLFGLGVCCQLCSINNNGSSYRWPISLKDKKIEATLFCVALWETLKPNPNKMLTSL